MYSDYEKEIVGVIQQGNTLYAVKRNGNDRHISVGSGKVKQIINGSGSAIIIYESGARYRFDYKSETSRQI